MLWSRLPASVQWARGGAYRQVSVLISLLLVSFLLVIFSHRGLRRNTSYRFKLRAHNEMGASQYSGLVSYTTRPGRPSPPPRPQTKGRVRSHSFKIMWNVPQDNGGVPVNLYHLELDDGSGWVLVFSGEEMEHVCGDLVPGVQYR